jgi:hypothetical protein
MASPVATRYAYANRLPLRSEWKMISAHLNSLIRSLSIAAFTFALWPTATAQSPVLRVDWNSLGAPTKTTITLQVVENPPLMRDSRIHDAAWRALAALKTDKTRLALWYPYPRLAVAELAPPAKGATSWDFSAIDPIVEDFFAATSGRSSVFTMSTIPRWMFAKADPGPVPASPAEAMWNYEDGADLRDTTGNEVAEYYARVAGWYMRGGFVDEFGVRHTSPHHFKMAYWEVLNEPEYEHALSIEAYTRLYDKITAVVHAVSPETKFVGMSLAEPTRHPEAFEYFLNPTHHAAGTKLDAISYHFYADAEPGESDDTQQYTFFARADGFLDSVRYIESIRKRLSPQTETHINEAGCIAADDLAQGAEHTGQLPSAQYWNLCGAVFAYLYAGLAEQGIDLLGASQLMGYPSQFPSVSLLDWNSGAPNARYRVLELLHKNVGPGDRPAKTTLKSKDVFAAAYLSHLGSKKILLINKRARPATIFLDKQTNAFVEYVDLKSASTVPVRSPFAGDRISLGAFSVCVVTLSTDK